MKRRERNENPFRHCQVCDPQGSNTVRTSLVQSPTVNATLQGSKGQSMA
jgi:hypothetical protein